MPDIAARPRRSAVWPKDLNAILWGKTMLELLRRMQARLDGAPHMLRLGRLVSETVLLRVDGEEYYLVFDKGRLAEILPGPSRKTPWRFAIATDSEALAEFWKARPRPGFHDVFGLVTIGRAKIEGDILTLVKNLRFFKEFLAIPRDEAKA